VEMEGESVVQTLTQGCFELESFDAGMNSGHAYELQLFVAIVDVVLLLDVHEK